MRDRPSVRPNMAVDAGLRAFMLGVYNKMGLGLVVSAGLAWATASVAPVRDALFVVADGRLTGYTPVGMVLAFAPARGPARLCLLRPQRVAPYGEPALLVGRGADRGLARCRGAALHGSEPSLDLPDHGRDRPAHRRVVNIFLQCSMLILAITGIGVLIFAGLTAYDTQRLNGRNI